MAKRPLDALLRLLYLTYQLFNEMVYRRCRPML